MTRSMSLPLAMASDGDATDLVTAEGRAGVL